MMIVSSALKVMARNTNGSLESDIVRAHSTPLYLSCKRQQEASGGVAKRSLNRSSAQRWRVPTLRRWPRSCAPPRVGARQTKTAVEVCTKARTSVRTLTWVSRRGSGRSGSLQCGKRKIGVDGRQVKRRFCLHNNTWAVAR